MVGAATAALGGGNAAQGALGAGVGEAATPWLVNTFGSGTLPLTTALLGGAVGGGAGAGTASAGAEYNYLTHPQRSARAAAEAGCADQACVDRVNAAYQKTSVDQNVQMADYLIGQGNLPASLAEQLASTDPGSVGYTALLNQAAAYESLLNPTAELDYQFINEIDGEPKVGKYDTSAADNFGKAVGALLWGTSMPAIADEGIGGSELEGAAAEAAEVSTVRGYPVGEGAELSTSEPNAAAADGVGEGAGGDQAGQEATDSAAEGNPTIQFGANENQSSHTFRHVISGGYDATAVQNAVTSDLNNIGASLPQGQYTGTIVVNGTTFNYSAYKLPSGTINVGRITPPR